MSWSAFVLGSMATSMTGSGNVDRLEDDGVVRVRERVARVRLAQADGGSDVARGDLVDLLAMVGMQLDDAADALLAILRGVVDVRARAQPPAVDAEEGQLADERVGGDLEGQGGEWLVVIDGADDVSVGSRVTADDRRDVERRGQVLHDRVEHGLDALVAERRAREHRDDAVLERAEAQTAADLGDAQLLALEELRGQVVVELGDGLDHGGAVRLSLVPELLRDVRDLDDLAEVVPVQDGLSLDEVDDALEAILLPDRDLHRHGVGAEALADRRHAAPEVGTRCGPAC